VENDTAWPKPTANGKAISTKVKIVRKVLGNSEQDFFPSCSFANMLGVFRVKKGLFPKGKVFLVREN
jgi:hypothetical protein